MCIRFCVRKYICFTTMYIVLYIYTYVYMHSRDKQRRRDGERGSETVPASKEKCVETGREGTRARERERGIKRKRERERRREIAKRQGETAQSDRPSDFRCFILVSIGIDLWLAARTSCFNRGIFM